MYQFFLNSVGVEEQAYNHRRQTGGCSGCRCTRCFFGLVVLNKSRILLNKSRILILHPHFSGPFGANVYVSSKRIHNCRVIRRLRIKSRTDNPSLQKYVFVMYCTMRNVFSATEFFNRSTRTKYKLHIHHSFACCKYFHVGGTIS